MGRCAQCANLQGRWDLKPLAAFRGEPEGAASDLLVLSDLLPCLGLC